MSEPPPLPEGTDPYLLLGVPHTASALDLKRAYVERIKVYRPDRAPADFQRIRAAYEQALEILSWSAIDEPAVTSADRDPQGGLPEEGERDVSTPPQPSCAERPAIWPLVAADRMEAAQELLDDARRSCPQDPWPYTQRFLLEEIRERPFATAAAHLLLGVEADATLGSWFSEVLSRNELRALAATEDLALPRILTRPTFVVNWVLICARRDALLLADRRSELLDEVGSPALAAAAATLPGLRSVALEVALAAVFSHPQQADPLFDLHGEEPVTEGSLEEAFLIRRGLRGDWESWRAKAQRVPELTRHIEFAAALAPTDLLDLELSAAVAERPREHWEACALLASTHPHLRYVCLAALAAEEREPADDPRLESFVKRTGEELDEDGMNSSVNYSAGFLLIASAIFFVKRGWWGLAPLAGLIVVLVLWSRIYRRLYRRIVRPAVIRALLEFRCHIEDIVAAIPRHSRSTDDIGRFKDEIAADDALRIFSCALSYDNRIRAELALDDESPGE